ncbi:MAG: agmatine deiminase family protein [Arcobacter sp.]|uniref:agmatine deiminase family protein n=1 Tax=Arcobacter sp. TaxID=1872629 RepID=UPI003D092F74
MKTIIRLSKLLFEKYPNSANKLTDIFKKHNIEYEVLEDTKDIWARDYMPLCLDNGTLVSYIYNPDYLEDEVYKKTITKISHEKNHLDLVIDGGNFVRYKNKAIMTDKVFKENPLKTKDEIIKTIKSTSKLDDLIMIPKQPYDIYGHSDSMVRWVNENTILINDFSIESKTFNDKLLKVLKTHNLNIKTMKYSNTFFTKERNWGAYLNFIKIDNLLIVPIYGISEDILAINQLKNIYENCTIETIELNEIIDVGGAINCITSEKVLVDEFLIVEVTPKEFKVLTFKLKDNTPWISNYNEYNLEKLDKLKTFFEKINFNKHYSVISFDKNLLDFETNKILFNLKKSSFEFNKITDNIFESSLPNKFIKNGFVNLDEKRTRVLNGLVWYLIDEK